MCSGWKGLWITGFQEVTSKAVIKRNVQTIYTMTSEESPIEWASLVYYSKVALWFFAWGWIIAFFSFVQLNNYFSFLPLKRYICHNTFSKDCINMKDFRIKSAVFLCYHCNYRLSKWGLTKDKTCLYA